MADCRITHISKSGRENFHEHITHVGSTTWKWTREQVVASIEANTNTFYVLDQRTNSRAEVGVVRPSQGTPYLRTYANGVWTDNLLSLPEFPATARATSMDARF